jgi:Ni/Fe-hydrogenase subunit HybB-like protein
VTDLTAQKDNPSVSVPVTAGAGIPADLTNPRLDDDIYRPLESFPTFRWWLALAATGSLATLFVVCLVITVGEGIGRWGVNQPVGWGFAIINFVFWIGIGHAGTLISAILYVLRQPWRTSISRFSEAMTIFAVIVALQFPLFHTGRPWNAVLWLVPLYNDMSVYQNFRSPLIWDVFAVGTYGLVSMMFWYIGLMNKLIIATSLMIGYSYVMELFMSWYSGQGLEWYVVVNRAMGVRPSPMGTVTLTGGAVGLVLAVLMTGGLSVFQYPVRIGGKPLFSWQAFVPIFFELFVLLATLSTFVALIVMCKLGRWHSPLHDSGVMKEITCGQFAIVLRGPAAPSDDPALEQARRLLADCGCRDIRPLMEEA